MSLWGDDDSPLGDYARRRQREEQNRRPGVRQNPMTVTQAVHTARHVLEKRVGMLWIEGETTSVQRASSGHYYFALKDRRSQISAVMWRREAGRLRFRIEDGQKLRCHGQMTVYDRSGRFQLQVQYAEPAGLGADAMALEQLKRKLAAEGLFDPGRKRPLPRLPRRIGVVTSKSGAAIRDIIRTVHRRFPVPILVADATVQGRTAPRQIAAAIRALATTDVDVMIIGRGGGSASDLAAFNEEVVVRAIAACPVPTISAVGHEVDISLSDMVADRRAATPTMAGEMAVPVLAELAELLAEEEKRLHREMSIKIHGTRQELDQLVQAATQTALRRLGDRRRALDGLGTQLQARHPRARLIAARSRLGELHSRLDTAAQRRLDAASREFSLLAAKLDSLSPLRVLDRGYSITTSDSRVILSADQVAPGDPVHVRLANGTLDCRVEATQMPGDGDAEHDGT